MPDHAAGPTTQFPSRRARRMRVLALTLLVIAGTVNYLDRSALSIGNSSIRASLHLNDTEMGLLLSAFAVAYGIAQLPVGILIDRHGPRRLMSIGLILWSAAQIAAGFVTGLGQFMVARVALGIGESPMYLAGTKVCSNWFRAPARALPIGLFNASSALGPAIAPPILTSLMIAFGWRPMFVIIGVAGLIIAVLWNLIYRDPPHYDISRQEQLWIHAEDSEADQGETLTGWPSLFKEPNTWGMAIGFFGVIYLTWLYGSWLPAYLERARHLSVSQAGIWTAVPQACGFFGALLGGVAAHALARRGMQPVASCRLPLVIAMLITAACTAGVPLVHSTASAVLLVSISLFCGSLASSCGWAMAAVATTPNKVATLEAIQNIGGSIGGALAPALTGLMVQLAGSFTPALLLAAGISVLSALVYQFGTRDPAPSVR